MLVPHLHTDRLHLRPWRVGDAERIHQICIDPHVRRYLWDDVVISEAQAAEVLELHFALVEQHGLGFWMILSGADTIGFCGFRLNPSGTPELLVALLRPYWRDGFATEACLEILTWFWQNTGFEELAAEADAPNARSWRLLERIGFVLQNDGEIRSYSMDRQTGLRISES